MDPKLLDLVSWACSPADSSGRSDALFHLAFVLEKASGRLPDSRPADAIPAALDDLTLSQDDQAGLVAALAQAIERSPSNDRVGSWVYLIDKSRGVSVCPIMLDLMLRHGRQFDEAAVHAALTVVSRQLMRGEWYTEVSAALPSIRVAVEAHAGEERVERDFATIDRQLRRRSGAPR